MKTTNNTPAHVQELGEPLAALLGWIDRHPRTASALLWLQVAAILYAVINYRFTTL